MIFLAIYLLVLTVLSLIGGVLQADKLPKGSRIAIIAYSVPMMMFLLFYVFGVFK